MSTIGLEFDLVEVIEPSGNHVSQSDSRVYGAQFCSYEEYGSYFAITGGISKNSVSIYEIVADKSFKNLDCEDKVSLVQTYRDCDESEDYFCCCWALSSNNSLLLLVAGYHAVIKGINVSNLDLEVVLPGHLSEVNEMQVVPTDPSLLLSASKDESIRLWNIYTRVCIAIFSGSNGHAQHVLTIDVHPLGNCFASAGFDCR